MLTLVFFVWLGLFFCQIDLIDDFVVTLAGKSEDSELELNQGELKWGLKDFGIELTPRGLDALFNALDDDGHLF